MTTSTHKSYKAVDDLIQTEITDGADTALVSVTGRLLVDATGTGTSTEYTEGDTDATITGAVTLMEGAADTLLPIQGTVADGLLVNLGANNDVAATVTKQALTGSAPAAVSVGVASGQALASNGSRKGATFTNTSTANISLGFGQTAVLNSGITLYPGVTFIMDEYTFITGAINAIAAAATSNLGVQEFT